MLSIRRLAGPATIAATLALGPTAPAQEASGTETAIVAGGCFWCVEADFESVEGVGDAVSGFTGGRTENPEYPAFGTGHYEAVAIPYDPDVIDYRTILDLFFRSIDPTDAGGQFCDRGHSYTTAIFVAGPEERRIAEAAKADAEAELGRKIVTPILDQARFWPVDDYHQDYYKSDERLALSSVGVAVPKSVAYKRYRERCGRDQRVRQLWGDAAPFVDKTS